MLNFLKRVFSPKNVVRTILHTAHSAVNQNLDRRGLNKAERAIVDAVLNEFIDELKAEIDKI